MQSNPSKRDYPSGGVLPQVSVVRHQPSVMDQGWTEQDSWNSESDRNLPDENSGSDQIEWSRRGIKKRDLPGWAKPPVSPTTSETGLTGSRGLRTIRSPQSASTPSASGEFHSALPTDRSRWGSTHTDGTTESRPAAKAHGPYELQPDATLASERRFGGG